MEGSLEECLSGGRLQGVVLDAIRVLIVGAIIQGDLLIASVLIAHEEPGGCDSRLARSCLRVVKVDPVLQSN